MLPVRSEPHRADLGGLPLRSYPVPPGQAFAVVLDPHQLSEDIYRGYASALCNIIINYILAGGVSFRPL